MAAPVRDFLVDYGARHAHPVNAALHVLGVPMVVVSLYVAARGRWLPALVLFVGGYALQWAGHRAQGNEVGEVILLRQLWQRLRGI